jgi:hypothetical protein
MYKRLQPETGKKPPNFPPEIPGKFREIPEISEIPEIPEILEIPGVLINFKKLLAMNPHNCYIAHVT